MTSHIKIAEAHKRLNSADELLQEATRARDIALSELATDSFSATDTTFDLDHLPEWRVQQCRDLTNWYLQALRAFNNVKDAALTLVGVLANRQGLPMPELLREYGVQNVEDVHGVSGNSVSSDNSDTLDSSELSESSDTSDTSDSSVLSDSTDVPMEDANEDRNTGLLEFKD